jgi:hypothetical protein
VAERALTVGDYVVLLDPRPILQLDYDVTVGTLAFEAAADERVQAFAKEMRLDERAEDRVALAVATARMARMKRREAARRLVLAAPVESLREQVLSIDDRQVKKAGRWMPGVGSSGWSDDSAEPPYLAVDRTHVCYLLGTFGHGKEEEDGRWPHYGFWVTRDQVRPATEEDYA